MTAAQLLARAFQEDPFIRWAEPDPARRQRTMTTVYEARLGYSGRHGGRLFEPGVGSVDWMPPSHASMGLGAIISSGLWRLALITPPKVWWRLSAHEDAAMARVRPFLGDGSVYLGSLGVEPSLAGRGHGGRLLQRTFTELARRWRTCVLRTEQPRNVAFYLKQGFTLVDESVAPVSGLRVWVFSLPLAKTR
ncbi:GNAT family N-acetyltransferase [Archangium lansingense]|uniref:GNAT family N-acetyltransferase n=1 Tax=Archangium lansingense TaxID=2995310 RepID=A0ABT4ANT4_9BACT|nr:GNAT family N-acetyltransferase [Archangium lansinium]MCY1083363.1 GNAT family N-acetyltransferase [Archangium lansinium]